MDKLLGKAVDKVFGDDDERPQGEWTLATLGTYLPDTYQKRLTHRSHAGLHQGGGNRTSTYLTHPHTSHGRSNPLSVTHGGAYPAGGGYPHADDADLRGAASAAAKDATEDEDFFADILGKVLKNKQPSQIAEEDIDEDGASLSFAQLISSTHLER
jgi:hypothetical protein